MLGCHTWNILFTIIKQQLNLAKVEGMCIRSVILYHIKDALHKEDGRKAAWRHRGEDTGVFNPVLIILYNSNSTVFIKDLFIYEKVQK